MDAQLEATYEGPEAVQRLQLSITMTNELFLRAVPAMDCRDAPHRLRPARHRRLHAGHRHATLALDAQARSDRHGRRRREALPQIAPGRDVPAGRRAVLAAGRAAIHPRRGGIGRPKARKIPRWPRVWPARFRSSPTFATCNPRAPPAKSAASAPRLFTATTAIRPGTKPVATPVIAPRNWKRSKASSPASTARPALIPTWPKAANRIRCKAGPCVRFAGLEAFRPPARQTGRLPHRLPPGQRPRRRSADQGDDARGAGLSGLSSRKDVAQRLQSVWALRENSHSSQCMQWMVSHPKAIGKRSEVVCAR